MRHGQTTLEYVYLVGIVAVALIATLVYIARAFQGNVRTHADELGEQYSPKNMSTSVTEASRVSLDDYVDANISTSRTTITTTISGQEKITKPLKSEGWH